jgi:hypothetical protein
VRVLGLTTLVLTVALAAPPALAVDVPPVQLPPVQLPSPLPLPTPAVPLPPTPSLPLPPVPTPSLPATPVPTPDVLVPTVAPPAVTAAPATEPSRSAADGAPSARAAPAAERATSRSRRATETPVRSVRADDRPSRTTRRRPARRAPMRPIALRPAGEDAAGAPRRVAAPPPAPKRAMPRSSGLAGDVVDIVRALPAAVLWALLGSLTLALGLAGNAFWQSRQRTVLERQRTMLLEDIGLLSSALLPPMPDDLHGLEVTAAYEPAEGPAAGGDFYDVFALDDERVGVLLGDVSGHGRASVRHAALARYTLRTLLAAGYGPGEALARADALLARELPPDFVTVIAAVYDRRTGELAYAKAGHAPPIVLGVPYDGAAEEPACPIGLGLGQAWPEYRLDLVAGVTVGLVTDGLEDARSRGKRLGRDEVVRLLAEQAEPDAAALLGGVRELADTLPDDTAAVVLTRRAS